MTRGPAAGLRSHARVTLGFASGPMPGALVILAGAAAGPSGLGLLSPGLLESLDPALPVALAALGVFVGIGFNLRVDRDRRALTATSVRTVVTMAVVGAGIALLLPVWAATLGPPAWFNGAVIAISAADDPLSVLLGGIALAFLREAAPAAAAILTVEATGVTLAIAAAGWLLLSRSTPGAEQRIFVIALLLLLGGASEYLSLSALTAGLVAGFVWEAAGGSTIKAIRQDVLYVQGPLIALVLLVSGARLVLTPVVLALGLAYVGLRVVGTMAGSAAARRLVPSWRADTGPTALSPGIVGLAFALNALRAAGPDAAIALSIVGIGIVGSELLAPALTPQETAE
jgi:hypothetical protein